MTETLAVDPCALDRNLLSLEEACSRAERYAQLLPGTEAVDLVSSRGRTLAENIRASIALPAFDQSAMDGYALDASSVRSVGASIRVVGRVAAGDLPSPVAPGEAARIFTGAPIPASCDTVVMQEHVDRHEHHIIVDGPIRPGSNVRRCGEDIQPGDILIGAGERLEPWHLAVLAAQGFRGVEVRRRPRITIISTGSELRQAGDQLGFAAVYDANRPMLIALAGQAGAEVIDGGTVGDDPGAIVDALNKASEGSDFVVTSGGASVGGEDHSASALAFMHSQFQVLRIAMKPGKPAIVGRIGSAAYLGLPGNTVAALVSWLTLGSAMLAALRGRRFRLRQTYILASSSHYERRTGRREFVPARIVGGTGGPTLALLAKAGSARLQPLLTADGFAELAGDRPCVAPGDLVPFHPFNSGFSWTCL